MTFAAVAAGENRSPHDALRELRCRCEATAAGCAITLIGLAGVAGAVDDSFELVAPYRPLLSSSAQLPAGQLEFEAGGLRQRSADARRSGTPCLFKLAFDKERGPLVGGEDHVWQRDAVGRAQGLGDTLLTLKRA